MFKIVDITAGYGDVYFISKVNMTGRIYEIENIFITILSFI